MRNEQRPRDGTWESTVAETGYPVGNCEPNRAGWGSLVADGGVVLSEMLEALADERRRYVLYHLREEGGSELEEVVEQVAAWTTGRPPDELDERTKRKVRSELHHVHLPKLENAGIIGYDRRHGSVSFRTLSSDVEAFLDYCSTVDSPETSGRGAR